MQYKNADQILIPFYTFIENDLLITTAGYTNFSNIKEPFREFRIRSRYSVSFVISGEGVLYIGKKKFKITAGDIFILPKNMKVKYYPKGKCNWSYFWFDFDGEKSDRYLSLIGFSKDNYIIRYNNLNDVFYQCESLISKKYKGNIVGYYEVLSVFFAIIDLINKKQNNIPANTDIVDSIKKFIKLHYARTTLTIEEICRNFNISHSYLCKLFQKHSELSAKRTIIKVRLDEAKKLLSETNLSVKQIAYSVGFSDDTYFMKTFKKDFGITPTEFRERIEK